MRSEATDTATVRPCVMVVEDDADDREIYGRILYYNGYDVVFAPTGSAALRLADEHPAGLVLLDLGLPDMGGLELLRALRTHPQYRSTPVIAISGYSRERRSEEAFAAGCTEYFEKPASPVQVLHGIERLVGRAPLSGVGRPPHLIDGGA